MSDSLILDTNVLTDISRGNALAAEALTRHLKSGTKVYIARAAYNELVTDAPTPFLRDQYRQMLEDLGITIAPKSSMRDRMELYADNVAHEPNKGQPGQIDEYGGKGKIRPGDVYVAAEARSVRAQLWTFDENFAKRASNLGVPLAKESSSIKGVSGTEDPVTGRKLLGLEPYIAAD